MKAQFSLIFFLVVAGFSLQVFNADVLIRMSPNRIGAAEHIHFKENCTSLERDRKNRHASKPLVPRAVISDLVKWIGDHTDYNISKTLMEPPSVRFCDQDTQIYYEGEMVIVDPMLRAAYDMRDRHIYLVRPWKVSSAKDLSTLLHELIHDVQYLNRNWPCKEKPEWEAYKLQEAWLSEQGVESEFNWLKIFMLSRCPRDIHP